MFLVDSHCHLDLMHPGNSAEIAAAVARAQQNNVHALINVCVELDEFSTILKTAEKYPFIWTSVGEHPNHCPGQALDIDRLLRYGASDKVIAIGETGLDYFRSDGDLRWQQERFKQHIAVAKSLNKPLIIHTREAKKDTLAIMQSENASAAGGVLHCFTEDWNMAKVALDMGFYISFSGIVTFKNATTIQEVARLIPLERMLIETDAPYLAPNPYRGKPNEPAYVRYTAEFLANLRGISLDELADITTRNFFTLFSGAEKPHV